MSTPTPAWVYVAGAAIVAAGAWYYYSGSQSDHESAAARAAPPPVSSHLRIIEELKLSDHELLRLVEIPDRYLPYNCVLLTDSTAGKTTMFCPDTGAVSSSPP